MREALVSVVISTYGRAKLLPGAIESVLRQSHHRLEILVIDDGSPDDTAAVVASIPDPRIRYLRHERNRGLPAGRNTGIRAARGEYIAFIDDDDEWRTDKLEKQLLALERCDAVLCMAVSNGYPMRIHKRESITLDDLRKGSFNPSGLVVRSEIIKELLFDEDLRQGEDWDAFIRIAQRCRIAWIPEPLVAYNESSPGRMTAMEGLAADELGRRTAVLHKHRSFFGERWFRYHMADACLSYIGQRRGKAHCLRNAVQLCGTRAVAGALAHRTRRRFRRLLWTGRGRYAGSTSAQRIGRRPALTPDG